MPLAPGQSLQFYEILGPLGAGGMGEVYRARDTRLEREVAIKVLPEELADDEERLRRFEREAKTLASLNHPNVAGIHGVDQEGDLCFLALELVAGEDLATRLARGALPVDEAIDVCRQIAEGLEAAHEAGVVHRDLKPANLRITPDGVVKILDFGLAKPIRPKTAEGETSTAESDSFLMTEEGLVLGTPTYMSPEQARGKPVDRRTDIWAFGCVLFECLTGERAFGGESLPDVLASIVGTEPEWNDLPALPERVSELLRRTLTKDPRDRLRDMGEARIALEQAAQEPDAAATTAQPGARSLSTAWIAMGSIAVAVAFAMGFTVGRSTSESQGSSLAAGAETAAEAEVHAQVHTFAPGDRSAGFQISPDGRSFAWKDDEGVWVRRLNELVPVLVYADEVDQLRWSPDSRELAFLQDGATWRIAASGGRPERVPGGEADDRTFLDWLEDGRLLYGTLEQVWTLPADGGEREVLLEPTVEEPFAHWHMIHPLPGGGVLGALHRLSREFDAIEVFQDGESEDVFQVPGTELGDVVLTSGGLLVYSVEIEGERSLWSVPFSLDEAKASGEPRIHAKGARQLSVSRDGALAYLLNEAGPGDNRQLAWLDLDESELSFLDRPHENLRSAALSPDGRRIVFGTGRYSRSTFSVHDLDRGVSTPVIQHEGLAYLPIWVDEGRIAVSSFADSQGSFAYAVSGRGEPEQLSEDALLAVSPDGQYFVYATIEPEFADAVCRVVGPGFDGEDLNYLSREGRERFVRFSPDGEWMLYSSERSGTRQLYLSPFPPTGDEDWSVCVGETRSAWFREDMSAIYYTIFDAKTQLAPTIHRVELSLEPEVKLGAPELLRQLEEGTQVEDYDGADRFLVISGMPTGGRRAYVHTGWSNRNASR